MFRKSSLILSYRSSGRESAQMNLQGWERCVRRRNPCGGMSYRAYSARPARGAVPTNAEPRRISFLYSEFDVQCSMFLANSVTSPSAECSLASIFGLNPSDFITLLVSGPMDASFIAGNCFTSFGKSNRS